MTKEINQTITPVWFLGADGALSGSNLGRFSASAAATLIGAGLTSGTLAQFSATTSAQLAGVISDETGTGALVFANSPTLVTPALGTPSSGTLTNCTGYTAANVVGLGTLATQNGTFSGTSSGTNTGDQDLSSYATTAAVAAGYQPLDGDLTALAALTGTNNIYYRSASNTWTAVTIGANLTFSGGTLSASSGGVTDGDKGDITVTSSGTVWTIDNAVVTLAKMANLAQDQFIGRVTASTGVPETATITAAARTVLDDTTVGDMVNTLGGATSTGSGGLVRATSPTLVTPALGTPSSGTLTNCTGLPTAGLVNDAVTFAKMQEISGTTLVGRHAGGNGDIQEVSVGGGIEFSGSGIRRSALTGDVTASAGSDATTIANDSVTYAKIQNVSAASRLLGRGDSGSGDVQEITLGTNLTMSGSTLNASGGGGGGEINLVFIHMLI
jgi:hypothetical protein